jgi:predicted metalloprotease with PDZ domain
MRLRPLHFAFFALVAGATALVAQESGRCSASAHECELEIRQMLSGRRYLGAQIIDGNPGVVIKSINNDGPAVHADLLSGDRIIAVNGHSLMYGTVREYKSITAEVKDSGGMLFMIVARHGAYHKVEVRLWPFPKAQVEKIIAAHLATSHGGTAAGSQQ